MLFDIFKKKVNFIIYGQYSIYKVSFGNRKSIQTFSENGIEPPLGLEAYGTGLCFFELANNSYACEVLALDNEVINKHVISRESIYKDNLYEPSYVAPYREENPNVKQLTGYMRTINVPNDLYLEWVEKMKRIEEIKEHKK